MHETWKQLQHSCHVLVDLASSWWLEKMLRLPELSPRAGFARRELRGVLDEDWLPELCDIASPTIASTAPVLKFKLDGSLPEVIWLEVDIKTTIQQFKNRYYSQWRRPSLLLKHFGAKHACRNIKLSSTQTHRSETQQWHVKSCETWGSLEVVEKLRWNSEANTITAWHHLLWWNQPTLQRSEIGKTSYCNVTWTTVMELDMEEMMKTKNKVLGWSQIQFKSKVDRRQSWVQIRKKSK